jgi:hypothetical protein
VDAKVIKKKEKAKRFWPFFSELYGDNQFKRHIAPHVVDTLSACHHIDVRILQPTQMTLIGTVQQIVGRHVQFGHLPVVE